MAYEDWRSTSNTKVSARVSSRASYSCAAAHARSLKMSALMDPLATSLRVRFAIVIASHE